MNEQSVIRVLIADDHPVVREGLAAMINRRPDMQVVAEVENGRFAITAYQQHRPDIALIDLRMPELGGVDAINAIRADFPDARIIILTTY
ncbi:MAG: response regulator transcription factor, partial [Anaerolineales bacterium]|nr:response regulator transcription factor [Anaerolineales bacterium]